MITLALAEDHQALTDGISLLLKYEEDIEIVGTATNGEQLLEIIHLKQPKVVITDIKMPVMDGITATRKIKENFPHIKVIAFSMFEQEDAVKQMIDARASGYLLKNSPLEEVLHAIRTVAKGDTYFDKTITLSERGGVTPLTSNLILTKSETEILKLIGQGKTTSEIATIRFTAVSTVEKHRKNMIFKLGLSGKGELLRYAIEKKYDF